MDNSTYNVRLEQWTSLVQSCSDSGLTKAEWCRQNNIKIKTYYYWQRRVRKHALMLQGVSADSDMPLTAWIPETHNYGIRHFPISGVAISGVTPRSR